MISATILLLCGMTFTPPAEKPGRLAHVRTAAGQRHEGTILSWKTGEGLSLQTLSKTTIEIPSQDVDKVTLSPESKRPSQGTWLIEMRNDSNLSGDVVGGDDAKLLIKHSLLGNVELPLDQLLSIRRRHQDAARAQRPAAEWKARRDTDSILLANRDLMTGTVATVHTDGISILSNDNEQTLSWSVIEAVHFAAPAGAANPSTGIRLRFADGSVILARAMDWHSGGVKADLGKDRALQFDPAVVNQIEVVGGRRIWLTDLVPAEYRSIPFFDRSWPLRIKTNALGKPLRLAGKEYPIGIGLHAAARAKWKLDQRYERLTAMIGIDDSAGRWADADVTIFVDQEPVAQLSELHHKAQPRKIDIDLHGASVLTIEVGFGRYGDVQDRVDLVNPALIRRAPNSSPQ